MLIFFSIILTLLEASSHITMMEDNTTQTNITGRAFTFLSVLEMFYFRICLLTSSQACQIEFSTDGPFMLEKWGNFKTNPYTWAGVTSQFCVKVS